MNFSSFILFVNFFCINFPNLSIYFTLPHLIFNTSGTNVIFNRSFQRTVVDCFVLKQCCSMITVSHTIPKTVGFYSERWFWYKNKKKRRTHFVQEENSHRKRYICDGYNVKCCVMDYAVLIDAAFDPKLDVGMSSSLYNLCWNDFIHRQLPFKKYLTFDTNSIQRNNENSRIRVFFK